MPYHCRPAFAARRVHRPVDGFAVLGDIIQSLGEEPQRQSQRKCAPTANPRFDVYETSNEYVLEGELPGVSDKKSISLEFTDARTLRVHGVVRRTSSPANEDTKNEQEAAATRSDRKSVDTEMSDATLQADEKLPSYKATVEETVDEDDNMSADFEVIHTPRTSTPAPEEPSLFAEKPVKPSTSTSPKAFEKSPAKETSTSTPTENKRQPSDRKYWVAERSYGKFDKAFTFASLVDQESVRASLENGVLQIHVPKREAYVRQVNID